MSVTILCRLCAQQSDNYVRIFEEEGKNLDLVKKITQCLQILLFPDDALPKEVCKQCCNRLDDTFKFHECCSQAQEILISLFNEKQPHPKTEINTQISILVPLQANFDSDLNAVPVDTTFCRLKSSNSELLNLKTSCEQLKQSESFNEDNDRLPKTLTSLDDVSNTKYMNGSSKLAADENSYSCSKSVNIGAQLGNGNDNSHDGNEDTWDRFSDNFSDNDDDDDDDYDDDYGLNDNEKKVHLASMKGKGGWPCNECSSKQISLPYLREHYMKEHNKMPYFKCELCSKIYSKYRSYTRHMQHVHRGEKKYGCEICSKRFTQKYILDRHRAVHSEERPFSCSECGKTFKQSTSLYVHNKNHACPPSFSCTLCNKLFTSKHALMAHMKGHSGERDFVCDVCGKTFIAKSSLDYHILTHNQNKPFICHVCGKAFRTMKLLGKHVTVHSGVKPFQCDTCGKQFRDRSALKEHTRIHTGAMPYSCNYCGKLFRFKGVLTVHLRVHTGERPYRCSECYRSFTNWANLNKHKKRKHKTTAQISELPPQSTESASSETTNICQQTSNEPNLAHNTVASNQPNIRVVEHSKLVQHPQLSTVNPSLSENPSAAVTESGCETPTTVHHGCESSTVVHGANANTPAFSETYKMSENSGSALVSTDPTYRTHQPQLLPMSECWLLYKT